MNDIQEAMSGELARHRFFKERQALSENL